jgi:hypothetical protein
MTVSKSERPGSDAPTDATAELRRLSRRVAELNDHQQVLDSMYRYGHAVDYGLNAEWVDCFTADGIFDLRRRGQDPLEFAGTRALSDFVAAHTNSPEFWHKHLLIEPRITIDGDRADVASYFVRIDRSSTGTNYIKSFGRYLDRLRRCDDGRWRFEHRIAESESSYQGD